MRKDEIRNTATPIFMALALALAMPQMTAAQEMDDPEGAFPDEPEEIGGFETDTKGGAADAGVDTGGEVDADTAGFTAEPEEIGGFEGTAEGEGANGDVVGDAPSALSGAPAEPEDIGGRDPETPREEVR